MKQFVLTVKIEEGNDEFWEGLGDNPGASEILEIVRESVNDAFPDAVVKLVKFEDKD